MTQTKITIPALSRKGEMVYISKIFIAKNGFAFAEHSETGKAVPLDRENAEGLARMYKFERDVSIDIDSHIKSSIKNEEPKEEVEEDGEIENEVEVSKVGTEDYGVYATNEKGKKVYFKVSKIVSARFRTKKAAKQCLEANGYTVQKILTEDEDRAWDAYMGLGLDVCTTTLWKYFRKSYKTGFCRRWTGKEWVDGWM